MQGDIFKADVHKSGQEWSRKLNTGIFWRRTLHHTVVVISDPVLAAEVLDRSKCPEFIDKPSDPMFYKAFDEEGHIAGLQSQQHECQAFDAIGSVGFGKNFNAAADLEGEGAKACHAVEQAAQSLVSHLRNPISWIPFTQAWRNHKANIRKVLAVMRGLLQEVHDRQSAPLLGPPSPKDESIAAHLMRVHDKAGNALPHARQWSELSIFFYAGVSYDISQHPEVEQKVVEELDQLGLLATPERPTPRSLELADLSRLTYLKCVIKESMRKRPVLPLMFRRAVKDVHIGPYLFPAGTIIEVHVLAMNTHPLYWDRPDDFLPVKRTLNFGDGRRICIGMPLAKLILPTNLALLLSQFSFRLADKMGGPAQVEADQENSIHDLTGLQRLPELEILDIFAGLPNLRCLYLKGNPLVEAMRNYRKTVISKLPGLTYLDERPIFDVERRCAEAWAEGGLEAERAERLQAKAKEDEEELCRFATLQRIRQDGFRKRRESLGMPAGDTDPFFENITSSIIEVEDDPPELVAAEQKLAQIQVSKGRENDEPEQEEWNPVRMGADEEPVVEPLTTRSAAKDNSTQLAPTQKLQEKLAPMPSTGRTQDFKFESADTAAT
ncbi:g9014 [Coccomyxa elongata]